MKLNEYDEVALAACCFALFLMTCVSCHHVGRPASYGTDVVVQPSPAPAPNPVPAPQVQYIGCFQDSSDRTLPVQLMNTGATVENCIAAAQAGNYSYAGVQYGEQCFAGNLLPSQEVINSACNMPCYAGINEICGGYWLNSVYSTGL